MFLDFGSHIIIIEIDENQHTSYEEICENKRTMEISQDFGFRPIIFIRFNPDSYFNIKCTSCWGTTTFGIHTIKRSKQKEWINRLKCLYKQID